MSAGNSSRGQQFAAAHADFNFVVAQDVQALRAIADNGRRLAREQYGENMQIFGQAYIVCRETEKEAQDFVREYVYDRGDWEGVRNLLDVLIPEFAKRAG